jgi:hypothetical protein
MRFSLSDVLAAAERLAGRTRDTDLAEAQRRASREDSLPSLLRDYVTESFAAFIRFVRRRG